MVCKLNNSLYGLAPAARIWYDRLRNDLEALGFKTSDYDPGLWIHQSRKHLYVTAHVDDFTIIAELTADAEWLLNAMQRKFDIKETTDLRHFLGMEIVRSESHIKLMQTSYINDLVISTGLADAHPVSLPADPGLVIDDDPDPTLNAEYNRLTGSLQWLASRTRPDIARITSLLAQFNKAPTRKAFGAAKHVIRYLKGSRTRGITFRMSGGPLPQPMVYTDSDWGGPHHNRRSVSGYVVLLAGAPISWRSAKQTSVALSSNEAEYMAASEAARETQWLRRLLNEMEIYSAPLEPIAFHVDNKGCKDLISSTVTTKRSKHIDIRYHYTRELAADRIIDIRLCPSKENAADGLTKLLRSEGFTAFLRSIGLD
jgi:hypothetical protein